MASLTCSLLLEVRGSWERSGEKAETESSKCVSHFENPISPQSAIADIRLAFYIYKMTGNKRSHKAFFAYLDLALHRSLRYKRVSSTINASV